MYDTYDKIEEFAKDIAFDAGKILKNGFRSKDLVISYKSKTDLVTNIDEASENFLIYNIKKRFPTHSLIAEEGGRSENNGDYIWYIDPIDGTNNFAHGIPFFCISLGIYSRDAQKMAVGVVYNPFLNEMFTAMSGKGAYCNELPIETSKIDDLGVSLLATGFPYTKNNPDTNNSQEFCTILPRIQGIRRMGSAAIDLCYVACGRFEGYWEREIRPWDIAAGSLIVEEAGGTVTKYNGSAFDPLFPEICASNALIHEAMTSLLGKFSSQGLHL